MDPHELIKQTYESAEPGEGFTERVLSAAARRQARGPRRGIMALLIAAVVLLSSVSVAAYASPAFRHWLFGVVEVAEGEQEQVETRTGDLDLTVDYGFLREHYGACFCSGRFLFIEVELTTDEAREISPEDFNRAFLQNGEQLVMTYDTPYLYGKYSMEDEGFVQYPIRLDDGSTPGYARYTYCYTLQRPDYEGSVLRLQLWEPMQWAEGEDGTMTAVNGGTRKKLAEVQIERTRPEEERCLWMADGSQVRVGPFGIEVSGRAFAGRRLSEENPNADGAYEMISGVVLDDGTRVPFLNNGVRGDFPEQPEETIWSAVPFAAKTDPARITALYCGAERIPLSPDQP